MDLREKLKEVFGSGYSYEEYRDFTSRLLAEGKTTGQNQSEEMIHYTRLNDQRMSRLDKKLELETETLEVLNDVPSTNWLVITEPWCGDAPQLVPLFYAMANAAPDTTLRLILRDENPEVMDHFEYKGSRAIPVLIVMDKDFNVLGRWGARPAPAQIMVEEYKKMDPKPPYSELTVRLQKWYNQDKTKTSQEEIVELLKTCVTVS